MKQFLAFVRKEFYHVFRDRKTLLLLFGMPIAQIILFGFALTNEIKNTKIAVCDNSNDIVTRAIIDRLEVSNNFEIEKIYHNNSEIEQTFREGKVKLVIVFPPDFNNDLFHTNQTTVQIIADASDPNTASTLTMYVSNIIGDYQRELMAGRNLPLQIGTEMRMIYNPGLKGATNFVPGVMALVLFLVSVLMTSVSIVREKELGTMEVLPVSYTHLTLPTTPYV
jgi:ABC-2 type transport system permease protein